MKQVRLGDICQPTKESVRPGERPELRYIGLESIESGSGLLLDGNLSRTPITPASDSYRFGPEHLLYGKLRPHLNKVALPDFEGICSTGIIPLLPGKEVYRPYLGYFLRSRSIVDLISARATGTRMPRADLDFLLSLKIPLPSLSDQRKVVDLASRLESVTRLHRLAEKKVGEFIPALFIKIFGDPMLNPKEWPIRKVSEFVDHFEAGENLQEGSGKLSSYRILRSSAVTSGEYREYESKPAPDGYEPPRSHVVCTGDMLFSRASTEEFVGTTAIVERTNGTTLLPDKLWRFVWAERVEPIYMLGLFRSLQSRGAFSRLSSGTRPAMRSISQAKLFELQLPVAPYQQQRIYAEQALSARKIFAQHALGSAKAKAAFNAFLARTFSCST